MSLEEGKLQASPSLDEHELQGSLLSPREVEVYSQEERPVRSLRMKAQDLVPQQYKGEQC